MKSTKEVICELAKTEGFIINGPNPWDPQIHNEKFYRRVMNDGILGLGESYMDKWWDCERLDEFFYRIGIARSYEKVKAPWHFVLKIILSRFINFQSKLRSTKVAKEHYDIGNDLYTVMLDKGMNYSCGYWKNAKNLDEAQVAKIDLICQKLQLKPGMKLLDIGCGWGGLAKYAAETYGVEVHGVTISNEQYSYGKEVCKNLPVNLQLLDYRDLDESIKFDRIVSVGMFEHVGDRNYLVFMKKVHRMLKEDGLFLLHTIGLDRTISFPNEWIDKYIFPNGMLPSVASIAKVAEGLFIIEDLQNFSSYYDNTLMEWYKNFNDHWPQLKNKYGERFYRMWTYYLLFCAGSFRARTIQLFQFVFSKKGVIGGYMSPR